MNYGCSECVPIRFFCCMFFCVIFCLNTTAHAQSRQKMEIAITPGRDISALVNQEIKSSYSISKIDGGALLEFSGNIPEGITHSFDSQRKISFLGSSPYPQTCKISVRAHRSKNFSRTINRTLNISTADGAGVYQATVLKLEETDTHSLYQITVKNNQGLPLVKATLETLISGSTGAPTAQDSAILPQVEVGKTAVATIWYEKGRGLGGVDRPQLVLSGGSKFGSIDYSKNGKASGFFGHQCTYQETVLGQIE